MGRGKQSESFTLEEVARYGIDDFSDQEIADLRARDRQLLGYREKLSEGGISNDALAEIQSSLAFTSALADGGSSETIEELLELLATAHVLNFAGVAGDSLSFDRLARPRMTLFGLIEPETSLICHEQKFSTEILHLRSSPMEDSALCGYELSVAQQRRWPRGVFQANRPTCAECFHLATIGAVDSALYERATESEDYVALDLTESEEIDAALAATLRRQLLNDKATDASRLTEQAIQAICQIAAARLNLLSPSERMRLFHPREPGATTVSIKEALALAARSIGNCYGRGNKVPWPTQEELAETLTLVDVNKPENVARCELVAHLIARHFPKAVSPFYSTRDIYGLPQLGYREISEVWQRHYPELLKRS